MPYDASSQHCSQHSAQGQEEQGEQGGDGAPEGTSEGAQGPQGASEGAQGLPHQAGSGRLGQGRKVSCDDIQLVQNLIERCLQLYMSQREVVATLQFQAKIEPGFTSLVWQKLEEQNPEFFGAYDMRLALKEQMLQFNQLLEQHAHMVQHMQELQPPQHSIMPLHTTQAPVLPCARRKGALSRAHSAGRARRPGESGQGKMGASSQQHTKSLGLPPPGPLGPVPMLDGPVMGMPTPGMPLGPPSGPHTGLDSLMLRLHSLSAHSNSSNSIGFTPLSPPCTPPRIPTAYPGDQPVLPITPAANLGPDSINRTKSGASSCLVLGALGGGGGPFQSVRGAPSRAKGVQPKTEGLHIAGDGGSCGNSGDADLDLHEEVPAHSGIGVDAALRDLRDLPFPFSGAFPSSELHGLGLGMSALDPTPFSTSLSLSAPHTQSHPGGAPEEDAVGVPEGAHSPGHKWGRAEDEVDHGAPIAQKWDAPIGHKWGSEDMSGIQPTAVTSTAEASVEASEALRTFGQIPRNFSLSDLAADFQAGAHSDNDDEDGLTRFQAGNLIGLLPGSPSLLRASDSDSLFHQLDKSSFLPAQHLAP